MKKKSDKAIVDVLCILMRDFVNGIGKLFASKVVTNSLMMALKKNAIHVALSGKDDRVDPDSPFDDLLAISPTEYDSFAYLTKTSFLVYATTLLDAFIHDCTCFLHLLIPESIGCDTTLLFKDILESESRTAIITDLARKKSRDSSYDSFERRVGYLKKRFGLALALDDDTLEEIRHFSGIRNTVVHTQSSHALQYHPEKRVVAEEIGCPLHPQPLSQDVFHRANRAYITLAGEVFATIADQVLHAREEKAVLEVIDLLTRLIKATYAHNISLDRTPPDEIEKITLELESDKPLSKLAEAGRELARNSFRKHLREYKETQQSI